MSFLKNFLKFYLNLFLAFFSKSKRFIRLSKRVKGLIYFIDKKNNKLIKFKSRDYVDSSCLDLTFTNYDYNFENIYRFKDIKNIYKKNLLNNRKNLILDCGSNIGATLSLFSIEFPDCKICAIEPDIDNYNLSKLNCKNYSNIDFRNEAIGNSAGYVEIINKEVESNSFQTTLTSNSSGIKLNSINNIFKIYKNYYPLIVKIDIEGFENNLFLKNHNWIKYTPLIIIELHDWLYPKRAISHNFLKCITKYDRDFIINGENIFSFSNDI